VELKNSLNQSKKNAMNYCTKTLKNKILSSQSRYLLFQMLLALRSPRTVRQASECPTLYEVRKKTEFVCGGDKAGRSSGR